MALNFGKCAKFFVVMQGENQRQPKGNKGRKRLRPHDTMDLMMASGYQEGTT